MLEAELNSLASSNQHLRGQLEAAGQQLAAASRERLAAQEAAAEAASKAAQQAAALQAEVDVLRSTAEVEAAVRLEMEAANGEVRVIKRGVSRRHSSLLCR
jgi:chromosome segregation ATPase